MTVTMIGMAHTYELPRWGTGCTLITLYVKRGPFYFCLSILDIHHTYDYGVEWSYHVYLTSILVCLVGLAIHVELPTRLAWLADSPPSLVPGIQKTQHNRDLETPWQMLSGLHNFKLTSQTQSLALTTTPGTVICVKIPPTRLSRLSCTHWCTVQTRHVRVLEPMHLRQQYSRSVRF